MHAVTHQKTNTFERFVNQYTVLLTTYKRDGTPVGTPVNIAVEGDHAYIRTWDTAWKFKRMRNNPLVTVQPSTVRGTPTGKPVTAYARILDGDESAHAGRLLARKHPFLHGFLVPLVHKLQRHRTMQLELRLAPSTPR